MVLRSISASARCSGHGGWWISAHVVAVDRVEAVALGEEVLQRAGGGRRDRADRPVAALPHERPRRRLAPGRAVVEPLAAPLARHACAEVRQPVGAARSVDGEPARGVEREEPDARLAPARHVRAHVQLQELGHVRERQRPPQAEAGDGEGRDAEPGGAVPGLQLQRLRHQGPQLILGYGPVREQQVVPRLAHDPAAGRQRPGPVRGLLQRGGLPRRRSEQVERHERIVPCGRRPKPR